MSEVRCPAKAFKLEIAGNTRARWCATIPADHTVEDVLHPNYFGRIANTNKEKLKFRDIIELEWEDGTKFGELSIRSVEAAMEQLVTAVRVEIMEVATPGLPDGWTMEFINPAKGWSIAFKGEEKQSGFTTQEAASMRVEYLARQSIQMSVARPALTITPARRKPGRPPNVAKETEVAT